MLCSASGREATPFGAPSSAERQGRLCFPDRRLRAEEDEHDAGHSVEKCVCVALNLVRLHFLRHIFFATLDHFRHYFNTMSDTSQIFTLISFPHAITDQGPLSCWLETPPTATRLFLSEPAARATQQPPVVFSLAVHLWCMREAAAGASMHEGAVLGASLCVKKVFALSLLGDAWGLPLTAALRAYLSACRRFTFI